MTDSRRSLAPRLAGLALMTALAVAGCSGSSNEPDQLAYRITSETAAPTPVLQAELVVDEAEWTSLAEQGARSTDGVEAEARFRAALEALGDSYRFESRIGSPDDDPIELTGRRVGSAVSYRLTAGGATVEVIDLGDQVWTRAGDGPWESAEGEGEVQEDPLAGLSQPIAVEAGADERRVEAIYDPAVLGFDGNDPLSVAVRITDSTVTFTTTTPDGVAMVSSLGLNLDVEPIVAPA